jgi:hypothetical protein
MRPGGGTADAEDLKSCVGSAQAERDQTLKENGADDGKRVGKTDPDFALVADAWPTLPAALKAGILAMVKATAGQMAVRL